MFEVVIKTLAASGAAKDVVAVKDHGNFVKIVPKEDCLDRVIALFGQEHEAKSTMYGEVWVR